MELNGKPVRVEDIASLSLYNYGNCTTMLVDEGRVRGLTLHLDRLDRDARIMFGSGIDQDAVKHFIRQIMTKAAKPRIVRVTVFRKDFELMHPAKPGELDILVTTRSAPPGYLPSVSLKSVQYQRDLPEIKSTIVGGSLYRRREAQLEGFDDAVFLTNTTEISEGPTWNIVFFKAGQVVFPATPSLPGVSVAVLQTALKTQGVPTQNQTVRLSDVVDMDSAVIVSAGSGLRGVKSIDAHTFKPDDALNMLRKAYETVPYDQL